MTTEDARKLFVQACPTFINEEVLRQLFEATGGTVQEVSLPKDRTSGRARGFGFVTLETPEQAERARAALDGSFQAGRPISVRQFQGGTGRRDARTPEAPAASSSFSSPAEDRTLYVGNLPYDATAEEVEQLLTKCGVTPVLRVHLPVGAGSGCGPCRLWEATRATSLRRLPGWLFPMIERHNGQYGRVCVRLEELAAHGTSAYGDEGQCESYDWEAVKKHQFGRESVSNGRWKSSS